MKTSETDTYHWHFNFLYFESNSPDFLHGYSTGTFRPPPLSSALKITFSKSNSPKVHVRD